MEKVSIIRVFTMAGVTYEDTGEVQLDPVNNSLVIHSTDGGMVRFYWPNVVYCEETPTDDD